MSERADRIREAREEARQRGPWRYTFRATVEVSCVARSEPEARSESEVALLMGRDIRIESIELIERSEV